GSGAGRPLSLLDRGAAGAIVQQRDLLARRTAGGGHRRSHRLPAVSEPELSNRRDAALPGVLRAVERLVGVLEETHRLVGWAKLCDPGGEIQRAGGAGRS